MRNIKYNTFPLIALTLLAGLALAGSAEAQKAKPRPAAKKAPAKKPAPTTKPTASKTGLIVLGTKQLPGDFGQFGQTYTVGRQEPINITLRSAEYTTARFNIDTNAHIPSSEQKLLVLHYTLHNPNPSEQKVYWGSLKFTAVDSKDVNHEFIQGITREGTTEAVDLLLKPAQKLEVQSAILVPAAGVIPKLILQREEGAPVVRYDLRGKVKPLPAPFADPADPSGATALAVAPAQVGTYYPCGNFDIKLDEVAYTRAPLGVGESAQAPEDGKRYVTLTFTFRNATNSEQRYYWATFVPELVDSDGEKAEYPQILLKPKRNESAEGHVKPGEEARARIFFTLPDDAAARTLTLAEELGNDPTHRYSFDLSAVK